MEEFVNAMDYGRESKSQENQYFKATTKSILSLYSNLFYVNFLGPGPAGGVVVLFNSLDLSQRQEDGQCSRSS